MKNRFSALCSFCTVLVIFVAIYICVRIFAQQSPIDLSHDVLLIGLMITIWIAISETALHNLFIKRNDRPRLLLAYVWNNFSATVKYWIDLIADGVYRKKRWMRVAQFLVCVTAMGIVVSTCMFIAEYFNMSHGISVIGFILSFGFFIALLYLRDELANRGKNLTGSWKI